jgi:hypothetical protein
MCFWLFGKPLKFDHDDNPFGKQDQMLSATPILHERLEQIWNIKKNQNSNYLSTVETNKN